MLGLDLDFTCAFKDYWARITFFSMDYDPGEWGYSYRLLGINFGDDTDDLKIKEKAFNLFYLHNSSYLAQLDIFFINIYTKFKN